MTFEQEVWDVICAAAIHAEAGATASRIADVLAPRVAAAILATREAAHRAHQGADMMAYVHGARWTDEDRATQVQVEEKAALAALRGETP